jgi:hypothetical protein
MFIPLKMVLIGIAPYPNGIIVPNIWKHIKCFKPPTRLPLAPGTTSCHSVINWWENRHKLREMKHWRYIPHDIPLIFSLNPWLIQQSYWWGLYNWIWWVLMDLMGKTWDRLSQYIYRGLSKNTMARKHVKMAIKITNNIQNGSFDSNNRQSPI